MSSFANPPSLNHRNEDSTTHFGQLGYFIMKETLNLTLFCFWEAPGKTAWSWQGPLDTLTVPGFGLRLMGKAGLRKI